MKVNDFEVEYESGLFNCCAFEIEENNSPCEEGDEIECPECHERMVLCKTPWDNELKWRNVNSVR
jgi:hypothetical protein